MPPPLERESGWGWGWGPRSVDALPRPPSPGSVSCSGSMSGGAREMSDAMDDVVDSGGGDNEFMRENKRRHRAGAE